MVTDVPRSTVSVLTILQNAWAKDQRSLKWFQADRRNWLYATAQSRSGHRLLHLLGDDCFEDEQFEFENTTPKIGLSASSVFPPDDAYVLEKIRLHSPQVVVACGKQSGECIRRLLDDFAQHVVIVPHPAHRLLTNLLYQEARRELKRLIQSASGERFGIELLQERGGVRKVCFLSPVDLEPQASK